MAWFGSKRKREDTDIPFDEPRMPPPRDPIESFMAISTSYNNAFALDKYISQYLALKEVSKNAKSFDPFTDKLERFLKEKIDGMIEDKGNAK